MSVVRQNSDGLGCDGHPAIDSEGMPILQFLDFLVRRDRIVGLECETVEALGDVAVDDGVLFDHVELLRHREFRNRRDAVGFRSAARSLTASGRNRDGRARP